MLRPWVLETTQKESARSDLAHQTAHHLLTLQNAADVSEVVLGVSCLAPATFVNIGLAPHVG